MKQFDWHFIVLLTFFTVVLMFVYGVVSND